MREWTPLTRGKWLSDHFGMPLKQTESRGAARPMAKHGTSPAALPALGQGLGQEVEDEADAAAGVELAVRHEPNGDRNGIELR